MEIVCHLFGVDLHLSIEECEDDDQRHVNEQAPRHTPSFPIKPWHFIHGRIIEDLEPLRICRIRGNETRNNRRRHHDGRREDNGNNPSAINLDGEEGGAGHRSRLSAFSRMLYRDFTTGEFKEHNSAGNRHKREDI